MTQCLMLHKYNRRGENKHKELGYFHVKNAIITALKITRNYLRDLYLVSKNQMQNRDRHKDFQTVEEWLPTFSEYYVCPKLDVSAAIKKAEFFKILQNVF